MKSLQPGRDVILTISRRGLLMEIPLELQEARPNSYEITSAEDIGKKELARLEAWLGQAVKDD
jgi:predicted metalloprotease with PDZ domain